ncbi:syndecan isoform X1 [Spodoptera frugiperda]|uniref:Syndecan n=2 Tax=Spodoptera frugiperda TaxID=7108 RepID=A0A9R0ERK8_SPOFR|nr:syndecan isoform X1 [Spodoptera frugiperda]
MHLRIYLWLSCVVLAGYVRATEDAAVEKPTEETVVQIQNDVHSPPDHDLFIDAADDGSGLDTDESSGSGWGAGPGPDDEDGRGSGDEPNGPPDDEDYGSTTVGSEETERTIIETPIVPEKSEPDDIDIPEQTEPPVVNKVNIPLQLPTDPRNIDVLIPNTRNKPGEGTSEEGRGAGEEQPSRPDQTDISISGEDLVPSVDQEPSGSNVNQESRAPDKVVIMNAKPEDRATSFFAQPGILAAVIGGAVVGLLCAILVVMFIVYRMRKKDEGSYALDEPKRSPAAASYGKGHNNREFYA